MNAKTNAKSTPKAVAVALRVRLLRIRGTAAPSRRHHLPLLLAAAFALTVLMALVASPALAGQARLFSGTFGAATSAIPNPYPVENPHSVAVDNSAGPSQGDVYVTDTDNRRIEKFDSAGHLILMFGKEVNKTKVEEVGSTEAEQNLCTVASGDECQSGTVASSPGAFERPEYLAVDGSKGPSAGDVYVADSGNGRNELQQISVIAHKGETGSFKLTFEGEQTSAISFGESGPSAQAIESALTALPSVGSGNLNFAIRVGEVVLSGFGRGTEARIIVEFTGGLSAKNVGKIDADTGGLPEAEVELNGAFDGTPGAFPNVTKFDESGHLLTTWSSGGRLSSIGNIAPIEEELLRGVAVDQSGNLWILNTTEYFGREFPHPTHVGQVSKFNSNAGPLDTWTTVGIKDGVGFGEVYSGEDGIAVDSQERVFLTAYRQHLLAYDSAGNGLGEVTDSAPRDNTAGFAIDLATDDLYVAAQAPPQPRNIRVYSPDTCHPESFEFEHGCLAAETIGVGRLGESENRANTGLAVTPNGSAIYVTRNAQNGQTHSGDDLVSFAVKTVPDVITAKATNATPTSARLNGTVNPSGLPLSGCFFEWAEAGKAYEHTAPCQSPNAAEAGSATAPVSVHADISGLVPGHSYHFRLVATNANTDVAEEPSLGQDLAFGPPLIDSTSVLSITASTATLQAELNPNNLETTYRFEYDTVPYAEGEEPHGTAIPVPAGSAGAGESDVTRSALIHGLSPFTTYHYRLIAENVIGVTEGAEHSFTTQGPAASQLPDGRAWELVSPPNKHGVPLESLASSGGMIQAAADGSALAYVALGPIDETPQGSRSSQFSQFLAHRSAPGDWSTDDIATAHQLSAEVSPSAAGEYLFFSGDLSHAAVLPFGDTPLSPYTTEKTPYLRQPDGSFTPLLVGCPAEPQPCPTAVAEHADVPPGTSFAGTTTALGIFNTAPTLDAYTPDLSHLVLESTQLLTEEFSPSYNPPDYTGNYNLYEWSAGALQLASLVPPGSATVCGGSGPACKAAAESKQVSPVGRQDNNVRNALSADGSRLVFEASSPTTGERLYLRDLPRGETVELDAPQEGPGKSGAAAYQIASADGSRIFFTDKEKLTADSTADPASAGRPDLYECHIVESGGHLACDLTDLSANTANPSEPGDVQGLVLAASEDGSSVYFVANGVLASNTVENGAGLESAQPGDCTATPGASQTCNLYLAHDGTISFLAGFSGADALVWGRGGSNETETIARVSPDGRYLTFMSQRPLTGYDNRNALTGERDEEVFLYDSQADAGAGKLFCASCNPSGGRPLDAFKEKNDFPGLLVDRPLKWEGQGLAANIPGWSRSMLAKPIYQTRYLDDSGRLFFNAADALVPADTNGLMDVYQYEPPGLGSCSTSSRTYSPASGGCVDLISSGTSNEESAFLDASETGNDVFFLTAGKLTPKDTDTAADIYDARVGGGEPEITKPVECVGDACQQPAVPPNDPTPGSLTFSGAGNVLECPKGRVEQKGKCAKKSQKKSKHRKKKDSKKQKGNRANANRGGAK